ncbi:beta-aspartyl-peptidase [candidate division GN15 bacterium]|nr:beta-aspartyl-peptidase [candidate division GN15 bacterium]
MDHATTHVPFAIAVHGGAGAIRKEKMTPEKETQYQERLVASLQVGFELLDSGRSAIDAVCKAVNVMEDSPLFNAGIGAVYTHDGGHEQDACVMDGSNLAVGAVAGVRHIRNPIDLARLVMQDSPHVLLCGDGAEQFAVLHGMSLEETSYFDTKHRRTQLDKAIAREEEQGKVLFGDGNLDHSSDEKYGTVGAVAMDREGNLAAATSTGGMTNKRWMRIGDTPVIGAGTYANNQSCAVSATGHGEFIMRSVLAFEVHALMTYKGLPLAEAARTAVNDRLGAIGGTGGLIAINSRGQIALPFNTPGMYRGWMVPGCEPSVGIYREDDE